MINILEEVTMYNDTFKLTFYYVAIMALLIGAFWAYYQIYIKKPKVNKNTKENVIYNNSEDLIEKQYKGKGKKRY